MTYDLNASHPPPTADPRAAMERLAEAIAAVDPTAEREDGHGFIKFLTADSIQVSLYSTTPESASRTTMRASRPRP